MDGGNEKLLAELFGLKHDTFRVKLHKRGVYPDDENISWDSKLWPDDGQEIEDEDLEDEDLDDEGDLDYEEDDEDDDYEDDDDYDDDDELDDADDAEEDDDDSAEEGGEGS